MSDGSANVANVYTESQHFALLTSAVERETAKLTEEKETLTGSVGTLESEKATLAESLTESKSKIDVLEAEKAAAEARADAAAKELADFKADLARKVEVAEKRTARLERVKAANSHLGEAFFSQERVQRWAEMADEAFEALVADLSEAATAAGSAEKSQDVTGEKSAVALARESAAFAGGQTATATTGGGGESTLSQLLGVRRRGSAA